MIMTNVVQCSVFTKLVVVKLLIPLQVGGPYELIPHVVELSEHSFVVNP